MTEMVQQPESSAQTAPRPQGWWSVLMSMREAFWVFLVGVLVVFLFFSVLGGVSPGQVAGVSIAMAVVLALWVLHAWRLHGRIDEHDPRLVRARERRGF